MNIKNISKTAKFSYIINYIFPPKISSKFVTDFEVIYDL